MKLPAEMSYEEFEEALWGNRKRVKDYRFVYPNKPEWELSVINVNLTCTPKFWFEISSVEKILGISWDSLEWRFTRLWNSRTISEIAHITLKIKKQSGFYVPSIPNEYGYGTGCTSFLSVEGLRYLFDDRYFNQRFLPPIERQIFMDWIFNYIIPFLRHDGIYYKNRELFGGIETDSTIVTFENQFYSPIRGITLNGFPWIFAMDVVKNTHNANQLEKSHLKKIPEQNRRKQIFNFFKSACREAWIIDREGVEALINDSILSQRDRDRFAKWLRFEVFDVLYAKYFVNRNQDVPQSTVEQDSKIQELLANQSQQIEVQSKQIENLTQIIANQKIPKTDVAVELFDNLANFL